MSDFDESICNDCNEDVDSCICEDKEIEEE